MEINGKTELLALIGSPVGHSLSPAMYNYCFNQYQLNMAYLAFDIQKDQIKETIDSFRLLKVKGFNITMPLKNVVIPYLDELSKEAKIIEAVNTVVNVDGKLIGYNTDGLGWVNNLKANGIDIQDKKMVLVGTGGAAEAICITCALHGLKELSLFARHPEKGERIVSKIQENTECTVHLYPLSDLNQLKAEIASSDILTNATNVGMYPSIDSIIPDLSYLKEGLVVSDVVYNPRVTPLLKQASEANCKAISGLGMLLYQGEAAFRLYTGLEMPVKEIEERYFK